MPDVRECQASITSDSVGAAGGRWIGCENGIKAMDRFPQTKNIWFSTAETVPNPFDLPKT